MDPIHTYEYTLFLNSCLHSCLILSLYFCVAPTTGLVSGASSSTTAAKEQALRAGSTCTANTSKSNKLMGLAVEDLIRDPLKLDLYIILFVLSLSISFGTFCACLTAAHFRTSKSVLFVCDDWLWNLQDSTWTFEKVWHPRGIPAKTMTRTRLRVCLEKYANLSAYYPPRRDVHRSSTPAQLL